MASSGSFLTNGWYSSGKGDYVYLEFAWSVSGTSIENNQKTIYWELRGKRTASGYVNAGGFKVVIDGETVYSKSTDYRIDLYNGTLVASGYKTFTHNPDGTRSFSAYIEGGIYTYAVNCTGSKTFELDTIPRASTITCTKANIESNPTITISRASSNFTHKITYFFSGLSDTVKEMTSATIITDWTIPESFYGQMPNTKEAWGTLTCITYNGNSVVGESTCTFWVSTDETKCKPTVSGDVVDDNPITQKLTGNPNALVRYRSTAKCTMSAALNKGAGSFLAKTINNVDVSNTNDTLTIPNVETNVFEFYAKDSRKWDNRDTEVVPIFVPYIPLTVDATIYRDDPTSGKATLEIEGNYYDGSFGAQENNLTIEYIEGGKTYIVTPTIKDNKYSAKVALTEYDYAESFDFEVVVYDKATYITKPLTLPKGIPVFDWGENDFKFNVPVTINGVNILEKLAELEELVAAKG